MAEDVRIDTSKIEVVSAKDNNKLLKDIAEVVDSTNPFVVKGQSKTLKDGSNYYLLTDPKYNWYKEVAQDCFAYKNGTTTKTERISAKGYRPRLNINLARYSYDYDVRGRYTIVIGRDKDGYYVKHRKPETDKDTKKEVIKETIVRIDNSTNVNSFYLLVHSQGGSGGNSSDLNGDCGKGGGAGCCSIIGITLDNPDYMGDITTVMQDDNGILQVVAGTNDGAIVHILTPGLQGSSAHTPWWSYVLTFFFNISAIMGIVAVAQGNAEISDARGKVNTIDMVASIRSAVTKLNNSVQNASGGGGGLLLECQELVDYGVQYTNVPVRFQHIFNVNGANGSSGAESHKVKDTNPEGINEFTTSKHSAGNTGSKWGAYKGGKGGGASLFANGGNGGGATAWTGGKGSGGSLGSGGGGAAGGMNGNSGGTGGNALIRLYW